MVMGKVSQCILLGHLLIAGVSSDCIPVECLRCNGTIETSDSCLLCSDKIEKCNSAEDIPPNCKKDFKVSVVSDKSKPEEGDDITLTCSYDLPNVNLTLKWKKNQEESLGQNTSKLILRKLRGGVNDSYTCIVESPCGAYNFTYFVSVDNGSGILIVVICGVSAVLLVVFMGLVMRYKLSRDNAKHRERMRERAQVGQSGGPVSLAPRES